VFLHESRHVAGLDHVNRTDSVMYPSYQSPRFTLYDNDKRSIVNRTSRALGHGAPDRAAGVLVDACACSGRQGPEDPARTGVG
jgi:hypothetical protein